MQEQIRRSRAIRTLHAFALLAGLVAGARPAGVAAQEGWLLGSHPCPGGNRTDALHLDDAGRLWVGCGTNATGYGLFTSADGIAWSAANVAPANTFEQYRVSSITTGHDGALYVAGRSAITGNRQMVLRVDTSTSPSPVAVALEGVNQVGRTFHVGNYRELGDGRAIAEDLNGTYLLYRPGPATGSSAADWTRVEGAHQILDLVTDGPRTAFYAGGSRINEPPRLFLPPGNVSEPWEFDSFALPTSTNWAGEIWGVATNDELVYAVGVDQDSDTGKIFISGANPYVASAYTERSMPEFLAPGPGSNSWARGVCANGDVVVVVGERQPLTSSSGVVLISRDRGATFTDITPAGVSGSVSKCLALGDPARGSTAGSVIVVAGAAGLIGIHATAGDTIFDDGFEASNN